MIWFAREKIAESSQIYWNCLLNPTVIRCIPRWGQMFGWQGLTLLERLGGTRGTGSVEDWQARLRKLAGGRLPGRFFAATPSRLREVAQRLGVHRLVNLAGCAAR